MSLMAGLAVMGAMGMLTAPSHGADASVSAAALPTQADATPVAERGMPALGQPAPNFRLKDGQGNTVSLEQYRGTVVMLNFWATWCGPCRVEMPAMEALYRMFPRKDFEILAVSTDAQGSAVTRPFQKELSLTFPILHDADFHVALHYGARSLPMTFLIDRRGIIVDRVFGAADWQDPQAVDAIRDLVREGRS